MAENEQVELDELEERLKALENAEKAVDRAYSTGKAERAKITQAAQLDAAEAVAMAGMAMEADEVADEAMRITVIAERSGDRDKYKEARKREREARKKANADHKAATKSAKQAYDAIKFSAPNQMGFMRVVQVVFALHIAFVLVFLMLTSRDAMRYDVSNLMDWLMIILEAVAFWMFINRYKIARPFVMIMAGIGIVLTTGVDLATGQYNLFTLIINNAFYIFLLIYFAFSSRVKATLVNDFAVHKGDYDKEDFVIERRGWPFLRNLIIYFIIFSILGHWMEMGMCQFIIMGVVQGEYDPTDTVLWRDWLYPFPMEGIAVVLIALFLYPLFELMKKKFKGIIPYVLSFLTNAFLCTAIEFIGGMTFNRDLQMWDYSDNFCNFMGQVCLQNTLAFGVAASLITWFVYPMLARWLARIPNEIMNIAFVVIAVFGGILWSLYIIQAPEPMQQRVQAIVDAQAAARAGESTVDVGDTVIAVEAMNDILRDAINDDSTLTDEQKAEALAQVDAIDESLAKIEKDVASSSGQEGDQASSGSSESSSASSEASSSGTSG